MDRFGTFEIQATGGFFFFGFLGGGGGWVKLNPKKGFR